MYGYVLLGHSLYIGTCLDYNSGELVNPQHSSEALTLTLAFIMASSSTIIQTSVVSQLVLPE